jgi:Tol biopolymer transport system component
MFMRPASAQPNSAGVRLEAGIAKEEADGDLKSAMAVYQNIAADSTAPRDVRAKALLRLAGCYEKLGRHARQVYEQIVRDYKDQPAAGEARSKLAAIRQQEHPAAPATMTVRKIERSALGNFGTSDTDGQRAVYQGSDHNLYFGDLAGHSKRLVFKAQEDDQPGWVPSRDFSIVQLAFEGKPNRPARLAVVKTDGTGYRELIRDDAEGSILGTDWGAWRASWSWDNRYLLVLSNRQKGGARLMVVSVADGQRHNLLSLDSGYVPGAVFSPDGQFVAYEVAPPMGQEEAFRIFVLPVRSGEARLVYESNPKKRRRPYAQHWELLDWTADGRYLAIADARAGKTGLYLYPIKNGEAAGGPVLVRHGDIHEGYSTRSGALVYQATKAGGRSHIFIASFDSEGQLGSWRRLNLLGNSFNPEPSFSPDGSRIAYITADEDLAGGSTLVLQELSTGKERELHRWAQGMVCKYAARSPKVFCKERQETKLFSVNVESGEVEQLWSQQDSLEGYLLQPSSDDLALYYQVQPKLGSESGPVMRWDLSTRQATLVSDPPEQTWDEPSLNELWLFRWSFTGQAVSVRPMSGGDWTPVVSNNGKPIGHVGITPDGAWILYHAKDSEGKDSLFRVAVTGGQRERLGDFPSDQRTGSLHFSRDGRQVMAVTYDKDSYDYWVLENFEPPAKIVDRKQ